MGNCDTDYFGWFTCGLQLLIEFFTSRVICSGRPGTRVESCRIRPCSLLRESSASVHAVRQKTFYQRFQMLFTCFDTLPLLQVHLFNNKSTWFGTVGMSLLAIEQTHSFSNQVIEPAMGLLQLLRFLAGKPHRAGVSCWAYCMISAASARSLLMRSNFICA